MIRTSQSLKEVKLACLDYHSKGNSYMYSQIYR